MRILASEVSQLPNISDITLTTPRPTVILSSPWIRPRLEGYRTAERGKAYDAKLIDNATVQFSVFLSSTGGDVLNNFQAFLTVEQAPLIGQEPGLRSGASTFPAFVTDVSGFFTVEGRISVNVSLYGVCRATLKLIRRNNAPAGGVQPFFTLVQVLGDERGIDVETKLHDRGES